jgi:hypothetical protein
MSAVSALHVYITVRVCMYRLQCFGITAVHMYVCCATDLLRHKQWKVRVLHTQLLIA